MIVVDFWKVKIKPYFQKYFWNGFLFLFLNLFLFNENALKIFIWTLIHVESMDFPFKISSIIIDDMINFF
jgi:hypothetical protein